MHDPGARRKLFSKGKRRRGGKKKEGVNRLKKVADTYFQLREGSRGDNPLLKELEGAPVPTWGNEGTVREPAALGTTKGGGDKNQKPY